MGLIALRERPLDIFARKSRNEAIFLWNCFLEEKSWQVMFYWMSSWSGRGDGYCFSPWKLTISQKLSLGSPFVGCRKGSHHDPASNIVMWYYEQGFSILYSFFMFLLTTKSSSLRIVFFLLNRENLPSLKRTGLSALKYLVYLKSVFSRKRGEPSGSTT